MTSKPGVIVRPAGEGDVPAIRAIFSATYGADYPYRGFYDDWWLKRSIFCDDIVMLIAEKDGDVLGTASVVLDASAHSDLCGEFGRLAVLPESRGLGIGNALMNARLEAVENRLHIGIVENRTKHAYSQQISRAHGLAPAGFLPLRHRFEDRESIALYAKHFGPALSLRCNHPHVVPEAHTIAHLAMANLELECDVIVDEDSAPYPYDDDFIMEEFTAHGLPALLRIERGRVRNREIFGPMRLHYGFFRLTDRQANYLVARHGSEHGPIAGAIGFMHDEGERAVKVFELINRSPESTRFLFTRLFNRCKDWGVEYVETDVSAYAPRMQRTLIELGFLPTAYIPAMVFHDVERLDIIKMSRLLVPPELGEIHLTPEAKVIADHVMQGFIDRDVTPELSEAIDRIAAFDGLNEEQRLRLASIATVQSFEPGDQIFNPGERADEMFVVLEGMIDVKLEGRALGRVPEGDVLGELSTLTSEVHSTTAVAAKPVVAARFCSEELVDLTRRRPDIGVVLYRNLARQLAGKLKTLDAAVARS